MGDMGSVEDIRWPPLRAKHVRAMTMPLYEEYCTFDHRSMAYCRLIVGPPAGLDRDLDPIEIGQFVQWQGPNVYAPCCTAMVIWVGEREIHTVVPTADRAATPPPGVVVRLAGTRVARPDEPVD